MTLWERENLNNDNLKNWSVIQTNFYSKHLNNGKTKIFVPHNLNNYCLNYKIDPYVQFYC